MVSFENQKVSLVEVLHKMVLQLIQHSVFLLWFVFISSTSNNDFERKGQYFLSDCSCVSPRVQYKRTAILCDSRNLCRFISAKIRHLNLEQKRMHAISFNFPSSCDHFEGGLEDFPHQEGTRILYTPPLPSKTLLSLSQPGLVYKLLTEPQCTCTYMWEISSHAVMSCNIR